MLVVFVCFLTIVKLQKGDTAFKSLRITSQFSPFFFPLAQKAEMLSIEAQASTCPNEKHFAPCAAMSL